MATDVSVQIAAAPDETRAAARAADACMAWLAEVGDRLTRFAPQSELSRLNAAAGAWFTVSELLFTAVERALAAARATGGLFDPALLPRIEALGYDRDFAQIAGRDLSSAVPSLPPPARERAEWETESGTWRQIELDRERRRILLPRSLRLDLGGIAKGWAADVALERYCAAFPGALVNVGGDLRLLGGPAAGEAWSVGIANPRRTSHDGSASADAGARVGGGVGTSAGADSGAEVGAGEAGSHAALMAFSRGGLATSGSVRRWWLHDGRRVHHLLDPRSGQPVRLWIDARDDGDLDDAGNPLIATATALAPTAARAEVAAKLALLRGYPAALAAVESAWTGGRAAEPPLDDADTGVALALVLGTGEVKLSANMAEWLATWGTADAPVPLYVG